MRGTLKWAVRVAVACVVLALLAAGSIYVALRNTVASPSGALAMARPFGTRRGRARQGGRAAHLR
jgi:hypothetical protein